MWVEQIKSENDSTTPTRKYVVLSNKGGRERERAFWLCISQRENISQKLRKNVKFENYVERGSEFVCAEDYRH